MGSPRTEIPEANAIDPFVCPRGHHGIVVYTNRFKCKTCRRQGRETYSWDKTEMVDLREENPPMDEREVSP